MKVAVVKYQGPMESEVVRGPSGETYRLGNPMGGDPIPVSVGSIDDAEWFEKNTPTYDVEWTATGELLKKTRGPASDIRESVEQIGYQTKKKIAGTLGVDMDGSPKQEELDEELEEVVEDLQRQMEMEN